MKFLLLILISFTAIISIGCRKDSNKDSIKVKMMTFDENLLLELHNVNRKNKLKISSDLTNKAQNHAFYMAKKNKLKHQSMKDIIDGWSMVGENIAWNQRTESEVYSAWMNSNGHRRNILNEKFNYVGFGFAINEESEFYWCACFGR